MWIFTTWGPIMPSLRKNCPENDSRTVQVRFRRVKDAQHFKTFYLYGTDDIHADIITDAGTDYDARIYVRPYSLQLAMAKLVSEIDYTSFKDQTEVKHKDKQLHDAYYAVWRVLYDRLSTRKAFSRPWKKSDWRGVRTTGVMVDEATHWVERRETREVVEWRKMSELTDAQLAKLHAEIDAATEGVEVPSDEELDTLWDMVNEWPRWNEKQNQLDHSGCTHGKSKNARRICRRAWLNGDVR